MKNLLMILVLFFATLSFSQSWKVEARKDAFSGNVKVAYAIGSQGDFPYVKPIICFRKNNDNTIDGFISDAGSLACDGASFTFAFNGKFEDRLTIDAYPSNDNDTGYFSDMSNIKLHTLVEKLKSSSFVEVLFETDCSDNRFKFNLSGSTEALKNVVGNYYKEKVDKADAHDKLIYPDYLIWKESIDNDITKIFSEYKVQDYYGTEDYSFDVFKELVYENIIYPTSDDLIEYFKEYNNSEYKKSLFVIKLIVSEGHIRENVIKTRAEESPIDNNLFANKRKGVKLTPKQ